MPYQDIVALLGPQAQSLLSHQCQLLPKELLQFPSGDHVRSVFGSSDRNERTLHNLERLYGHGRLGGSGYLSILPVDQDIEHTAAYSFYKNPIYFDPENVVKLALEAGCSGIASTFGALGLVANKYADKIPFIVKINHNELLTYPNKWSQIMFGQVRQAAEMGAVAVGATIYFGSADSNRQITEIAAAFYEAHQLGMATILWCYPRNPAWTDSKGVNYESSADVTAQANRLGVTLGADIIKQKMPEIDGAFLKFKFAKYDKQMYEQTCTEHPIDMLRLQVMACYAGKISLLNSGGESHATGDLESDLRASVTAAVINKRGGGAGLIMGRKAFKRPMAEGVKILQAVQDVYLEERIQLA